MTDLPTKLFFRMLLATTALAFIPLGLARIDYQHPLSEWGIWGLQHQYLYGAVWVLIFALLIVIGRMGLHLWFNHIFPRLSNTHAIEVSYSLPFQEMDFMRELRALKRSNQLRNGGLRHGRLRLFTR